MKTKFYFFYLEIALADSKDNDIYASENISHIPTKKLIEIFNIDLSNDPNILDGYFLTKKNYRKHREYIDKHMTCINFDIFEYCLRVYVSENEQEIRKLYKKDLME